MKKGIMTRTGQLLMNRFKPVAVILMYHRVAEVQPDPWQLCVTPQHFSEHLEVLRKLDCSLRLDQLAHALQQGKMPGRSVIITFDDGYRDNLYSAKPLLERSGLPATFFLSTGCTSRNREFWWDELDRLILEQKVLPERLELTIRGERCQWDLDREAQYCEAGYLKNSSWRAWDESPDMRRKMYYSLWQKLKPLSHSEREDILDRVQKWAGAPLEVRPSHSPLRPEEISLLAQGDLVEIGAHTVSHALLPVNSLPVQQNEIIGSKETLEDILGKPVTSFSYPYGNYTADTKVLVKDAGFTCACSTVAGTVSLNSDKFQLPRFGVIDWDGVEFEKRLLMWLSQ